jgi:plasmid stabilization system protein ParE
MAAEAATAAAAARSAAPAPSPDPRVIGPAGRLGAFYTALVTRQPRARGLDLLPAERRGGRCVAQIGLGVGFAQSVDYAAAVVVTYGPGVVGERDLAGARSRIQGWIDEYWQARDWDPVAGKETAKLHEIDTTAFRADFDVVISAVDAAGPRMVSALLGELGGVLREKLLAITPQWCAIINRKLEKDRAQLLEKTTELSAKHMREDPYEVEVYRFRGEAGRQKFASAVRAIKDPLLSTLFVQPDGLEVLRSLARGPDDGAWTARGVVTAALNALEEFRQVIGADAHWRYPEFIPPVLEGLGLGKVTGLADYLTAIADDRVNRTVAERVVEIGGLALMALGLMFSGGTAGVAVSGAGVALSGLGLGVAFIEERNRAFAVDAYALESGERQLFTPRFPVGTALAAAATVIAAIGFFFAVRGLGRVPLAPPPRPGAPRPPASSGVRGSAPPAKPSPTSPAARAVDPSSRLTGKSQKATGSWRANEPPRPYASVPPGEPPAVAPSGTSSPPPPPTAPRPPRRPPGAPRGGSEEATGGRPPQPNRSTGRVRSPERAVPRDPEQVERDAVRALDAKLREFATNYSAAQERIADVLAELDKVSANAELVKRLEVATAALEDPAAYGRLVAELEEQLQLVAGTPRADWEIALGLETDELRAAARVAGINAETSGSFHTVTKNMTAKEFFDEVVVDRRGFVDIEFSTDDHAALAHALQGRLIGDRLAQEGLGTVGELRAMLGEAKPPSGWDEAVRGKIGATAWAEIWDSTGARTGESGLHSPEFFTRMLKDEYPGLVLKNKPTLQP